MSRPVEPQRDQFPHRVAAYWSHPQGYPRLPDGSFDRDYLSRLPLDGSPSRPGGARRHFSPTAINPPSDSDARPPIAWEPAEPEQDPLGLEGLPTEHHYDDPHDAEVQPYTVPVDRKPITLHRGLVVDLAHPGLDEVRRRIYGPDHEHWSPGLLPGMPQNSQIAARPHQDWAADPELAHLLLDHLSGYHHPDRPNQDMSLGRHWSVDPDTAREFGSSSMNDYAPGFDLPLAVHLSGQWRGQGEDPYRRMTGGEFPGEHEITLLPRAPLHITDLHVQHPDTDEWHSMLHEPSHRTARLAMPARTAARIAAQSDPQLHFEIENIHRPNTVYAWLGHKWAGTLTWFHPDMFNGPLPGLYQPGELARPNDVLDVQVRPEFRRKGIATALYHWTKTHLNPDLQIGGQDATPDGMAWAESLGQRPERATYRRSAKSKKRPSLQNPGKPVKSRYYRDWGGTAGHP